MRKDAVQPPHAKGLKLMTWACMAARWQVPQNVLLEAVGGAEMVNGTCVERLLKDVLPVVRMLCMAPSASMAHARLSCLHQCNFWACGG
jgi:hypothetical protein